MRHLIERYTIHPGAHCGSASMRGLLAWYTGLELPEAALFGLGAGLGTVCFDGLDAPPAADAYPPLVTFGRTLSMELDLGRHLGVDYRERTEKDDDEAWQIVREEVLEGRPTMLVGDIFYLDYREFKVHFPTHRFVLLGFDDEAEEALIADRVRDEPETCSLGAVRLARNAPTGRSDENRWGRFHDTAIGRSLRDAAASALQQTTLEMLGRRWPEGINEGEGTRSGCVAVRHYAEALTRVPGREDAALIAGFNASTIEKFGNGGGNFRRLYADFLDWAHALDPRLVPPDAGTRCRESADAWTAASDSLFLATQTPDERTLWESAATSLRRVADLEEALFEGLADRVV